MIVGGGRLELQTGVNVDSGGFAGSSLDKLFDQNVTKG